MITASGVAMEEKECEGGGDASGITFFPSFGGGQHFFFPCLGVGNIFNVGAEKGNKLKVCPG